MVTHKKVLAVGEVGFVSLKSLMPRKARGMYIPQVETGLFVWLPNVYMIPLQKVNCNLCNLKLILPLAYQLQHTKLSKIAEARQSNNFLEEVHSFVQERYPDKKLDVSIVKAQSSNEVKRYVLITRRMKCDDDVVGPHDALRLIYHTIEV